MTEAAFELPCSYFLLHNQLALTLTQRFGELQSGSDDVQVFRL
jgi:hypothetical protein